jgi:hypothetical protein
MGHTKERKKERNKERGKVVGIVQLKIKWLVGMYSLAPL